MSIEFRCPGCDKLLRTSADKAGLSANCPECGELVEIPTPAPGSRSAWDAPAESSRFAPLPSAARAAEIEAPPSPPSSPSPPSFSAVGPSAPMPTRACPVCGEQIAVAAVLCRFCRSTVGYAHPRRPSAGTNGLALASMIMGITSIPMLCAYFTGIPLGIAAVTTGLIAWKQCGRGEGTGREFAVVGIICGALPTLLGAAVLAWLLLASMPI